MTKSNLSTQGSEAPAQTTRTKMSPAIERLAAFIGNWDIEITSISGLADPSTIIHGHVTFDWLEDGAFLIEHSEVSFPDWPRSTAIIAPDDAADMYGMLYFDSRAVSRIYRMTFNGEIWTLWRYFPAFSQRFLGTVSNDGKVIAASWEKSDDGSHWEHDFDIRYMKVS